jgi:hypothetical protein
LKAIGEEADGTRLSDHKVGKVTVPEIGRDLTYFLQIPFLYPHLPTLYTILKSSCLHPTCLMN